MQDREKVIARFDKYTVLDQDCGLGADKKVRRAVDDKGEYFAAKRILKWRLTKVGWENLRKSTEIHHKLCSYNYSGVVRLMDVLEDEEASYFIMEEMDGDLLGLLEKRNNKLTEEEASFIFGKAVETVEFIHSKGICHKDIKPENFLFCWDKKKPGKVSSVKLCDFELSEYFDEQKVFTVACGSPSYAAPEICVDCQSYRGEKADIWSLGITLFVLLCGEFPWFSRDVYELFYMISNDPVTIPNRLSNECQDLLLRLLTKNPNERISINEIKLHPWMNKSKPSISEWGSEPISNCEPISLS